MENVRYEELLPGKIVERRQKEPVAYLPLGGIEWHSEHLAVGNDALKAWKLCELAAQEGGGLAFPPLWYGEPRDINLMETAHDPGGRIRKCMKLPAENFKPGQYETTGDEQREFYGKLVYHVLCQLRTLGFRAIVILTGHYPIRGWVAPVVKRFNQRHDDCRAWAGIEFHYGPGGRSSEKVGGDHAAKWETSYLMALRSECVDMTVYRDKPKSYKLVGVGTGSPDPRTSASKALGESAARLIVAGMVRKAEQLLKAVKRA